MAQYRNATISIRPGNIVLEPADGLMTLINSSGLWFGGVDQAIKSVAGNQFHQLAAQQIPPSVQQGTVIFADGSRIQHRGTFRHVVFVIDDLQLPLKDLVKAGLREVYARGLSSVSLPMMRTGVMAGVVEKTPEEVALQMAEAVKQMADAHPNKPLEIKLVIYADASLWQSKLLTASASVMNIERAPDSEPARIEDISIAAPDAEHLTVQFIAAGGYQTSCSVELPPPAPNSPPGGRRSEDDPPER